MNSPTFVVEQLEEALEERQGSDRRKSDTKETGYAGYVGTDRREQDRRSQKQKK